MKVTALLCLLLTGCAVTYAPTKAGLTEEQRQQDWLDCRTRAAPIQHGWNAQAFVHDCMAVKGWRRESGW